MKIFIITGEESGDLLASKIIKKLKNTYPKLHLKGCGSKNLQKENIENIFPQQAINIMGFVEVVPSLLKIIKLINYTVAEIKKYKPDLIITVDAPDFNFRVIKKLKKQNFNAKYIHIVAPTVWAYREYRAKKIAKIYDLLLVLYPFEAPYFEKYQLKTKFIGHPLIYKNYNINYNLINKSYKNKQLPLLVLTLGSRDKEVKTLIPIYKSAINLLKKKGLDFQIAIPSFKRYQNIIKEYFPEAYFTTTENEKYFLYKNATAVIAKSGTNNLEIAKAQTAFVICYKVNLFTYILLKLIVKTKYVNLVNIFAQKEIIPEFIQYNCKPHLIAEYVYDLLTKPELRATQIKKQNKYLANFINKQQNPGKIAADEILNLIKN